MQTCQWFLNCKGEATKLRTGPVMIGGFAELEELMVCDDCAEKIDNLNN